jgi:hypothetical protein
MSESEKLAMLENLSGETDDTVLLTFLTLAGQKVIQRAYPYRSDIREVPDKYATVQVEIACYLLNKRGAEGETYHSENGINRSYENADVPDSMLSRVVPYAGVI